MLKKYGQSVKKKFKKLCRKFCGTISWKIRLTNCVKKFCGKLCRSFGGQIGWTFFFGKLVEKLCEKLCGKIVWNDWVEKLVGNLNGKIG